MPEFEAWPGQIAATRMMFDTHASSESGPRCYEHGLKFRKRCSFCQTAKVQRPIWTENIARANAHDRLLDEGVWDAQLLCQEIDSELRTLWKGNTLTPRQVLAVAVALMEARYDLDAPLAAQRRSIPMQEFKPAETRELIAKVLADPAAVQAAAS